MQNEYILALDASTKRTGYAIYTQKNETIKYGVISSASADVEKRICIMRDEIIRLVKENNIKTIIIEEVRPDGGNAHTGKVLTWLQGCIAVAAYEYNKNIEIVYIGPSSWRRVIGIPQGRGVKREQQKIMDIEYANKTYNLHLTSFQDDEADAICILSAYFKNAGAIIENTQIKESHEIGQEESAF